jgi:hypothetical protein
MRNWWRLVANRAFGACAILLVGFVIGCQKPKPSDPAPEPKSPADAGGGASTIGGNSTSPASSSPMTMEQLLGTLPKDKLPKSGPDGAGARNGAKEWLSQNVVGKSIEVAFRVHKIEKPDAAGNKYDVTPIAMIGKDNPQTRRPNLGIPVGETRVGPHQCILQIFGPDPTWPNVPASQLPKFEAFEGKVVRFRGKIESVTFDDGDNDQQLIFSVTLAELDPVADSKPTETVNPSTTPNPIGSSETPEQLVATVMKGLPKAALASEFPAPNPDATWMDKLVPADSSYPYHRMIGPLVDGQLHGEVRAYGPKRRLMMIENFSHGKLQGTKRLFYPSGKPFELFTLENNQFQGPQYRWNENGTIAQISTWKDGVLEGPNATFYPDGKPWVLSEMKNGKYEGIRYYYLPSGELVGRARWQNGKEVSRDELVTRLATEFEQHSLDVLSRKKWVFKGFWTNTLQELPGPVEGRRKVGEWYSLFNGKDTRGWWTEMTSDGTPEKWAQWEVKDGILTGTSLVTGRISHLISDDDFLNFHLRAEVRIDDSSNSGICFGFPYVHSPALLGYEAQIAMTDKAMVTGGLARNSTRVLSKGTLHHQGGEWFTMEIIVRDGKIVVKVNDNTTAEAKFESYQGRDLLRGHIGLQVHGAKPTKVEFRKVEIMPLPD